MEQIKLTALEREILLDRPEECIVECSCQFYEEDMIKKYGEYNKTDEIIEEYSTGQYVKDPVRNVYPESKVWDSCSKIYGSLEYDKKLPDELDDIDKMVLDDCISGSTMDRAEDVSPQYGGKVRATAIRLIDKLEKLGVKFSWAERWYS